MSVLRNKWFQIAVAILLGTMFPIVDVTLSLNLLFTTQRVPHTLITWVTSFVESKAAFLLLVNAALLVVGNRPALKSRPNPVGDSDPGRVASGEKSRPAG